MTTRFPSWGKSFSHPSFLTSKVYSIWKPPSPSSRKFRLVPITTKCYV